MADHPPADAGDIGQVVLGEATFFPEPAQVSRKGRRFLLTCERRMARVRLKRSFLLLG